MRRLIPLLFFCASIAFAQKPWYTAYYATWNQTGGLGNGTWNSEILGQSPADVDWTGITHVVHFGNGNVVSSPPYSQFATDDNELVHGPNGSTRNFQAELITAAHAAGVKVCLSIQAVDPAPLNAVAADSAKTEVFANWIINYAKTRGYDGVEIDWEGGLPSANDVGRIIRRLRFYLDKYFLPARGQLVLSPGLSDYDKYLPSQDGMVDQYNVQLYALMWTPNDNNLTWHTCAVYPGITTNGTQGAIDGLSNGTSGHIMQWINFGHDTRKMGYGLPTFGYVVRGSDQLFQSISGGVLGHNGNMTVDQNSFCTGLLTVGGHLIWDNVCKMHYISGTATKAYPGPQGGISSGQKFFVTLATPQWVQEVVKYGQSKGIGGYMLYSLTEDLDPSKAAGSGRNLIHDALRDALSGALPITISDFGVVLVGKAVKVEFVTLTESGVYRFYVEKKKSTDVNWTSIKTLNAHNAPFDYVVYDSSFTIGTWQYRIKEVDLDAKTFYYSATAGRSDQVTITSTGVVEEVAARFNLIGNYPNPFNPSTMIVFILPASENVKIDLYNITAQRLRTIVNGKYSAGEHHIPFNALGLASGTYILRIVAGQYSSTHKIMLNK